MEKIEKIGMLKDSYKHRVEHLECTIQSFLDGRIDKSQFDFAYNAYCAGHY